MSQRAAVACRSGQLEPWRLPRLPQPQRPPIPSRYHVEETESAGEEERAKDAEAAKTRMRAGNLRIEGEGVLVS